MEVSGAPALAYTGNFTNNGVLDLIDGPQTLPAGLINNGTVLNISVVNIQKVAMNGSILTLTIHGYAPHTYQLQRATSLTTPVTWTNIGTLRTGAGSNLTFTDNTASSGLFFYRVMVSP